MQHLEFSGVVRPIYGSLGVKWLRKRLKGSSVPLEVLCLACWWLCTLHVSTAE